MPQTGATRHQKFLKSEKSKTKLKSKKKDLPKGTNITKTNFKVKKIVIKEQLKKHGKNEALSMKKLNIKELLLRLNHFNTHSRTEALEGLKEIISHHPDILNQHLGQIIFGVTPLVLNVEKVVRHESFKVLHLVLFNTAIQKIEPFFDVMSTYLRSAMTHIDARIQEDSLLFLDLLLTCTPEKVAGDFHKILPHFLDMISKLRMDSKPGRTLRVNLGSQITSVKWRVKVLLRLKDYLNKYVQYYYASGNLRSSVKKSHVFDNSKMNHYSVFQPFYTSVCHISCFTSKNNQDLIPFDEVDKLKEYITTLMPLLFETWLEACPKTSTEIKIETVVNEDTGSLLKHSLEVISVLLNLVQCQDTKNPTSCIKSTFCQTYRQQFTQHFLSAFPFVTNVRAKHKKLENSPFEDFITDPKLVAENLTICHLFIKFNSKVNLRTQSKEINSVLSYVEKTFSQKLPDHISDMTVTILETLFLSQNNWTKTINITESLFTKIITEYLNESACKFFKQKLFRLLCNIALNDWLSCFHSTKAYEEWLKNLPKILLEESVTTQTVDILHIFAVKNNQIFNSVMQPNLLKILDNLPKITITNDKSDCSYHKLFSLLYWVKNWDMESLNILEKQLTENVYKSDHGQYIFDTLRLRVGGIL